MFCNKCGAALSDGDAFCSACGAPVQPVDTPAQAPDQPVEVPAQVPVPVPDQPVTGSGQPVVPVAVDKPAPGSRSVIFTILGLVFGILSVSLCWLSFLPFIPFALILVIALIPFILGLTFSIIGLVKKNGGAKGLAITGLIVSVIGLLLSIIFMVSILSPN